MSGKEGKDKPMNGKCIVIGAGDLTIGKLEVGEEDMVIAVDGGLGYCGLLGLEPNLILGDFDSVTEEAAEMIMTLEAQIPERIIRLPKEKDETDMLAALKVGLELGFRDFRIYAGMGGRFDHSLANVQCLLYLKNRGAVGYLVDGAGMTLVVKNEEIRFKKGLEGYLSLFALTECVKGVNIRGMKYPLENEVIYNDFPIGISNEFIDEEAVISVEEGSMVCCISYVE